MCQNQCPTAERVRDLEAENAILTLQAGTVDELLNDIAAISAAQIAVKAIAAEAVKLLTETETVDSNTIKNAVLLLKQVKDY